MIWTAFDTETTGLEPGSRMLELAAVTWDDAGTILDRFAMVMCPGMPVPADATAVHGITDPMVEGRPGLADGLRAFMEWLHPDAVLVGHNSCYDQDVITWACRLYGLEAPFGRPVVDTCAMARLAYPGGSHSLGAMAQRLGVPTPDALHRAPADAEVTRRCFLALRQHTEPQVHAWTGRWSHPSPWPDRLAAFPAAVAAGQPVALAYQSPTGFGTKHTITPYGWAALEDGRLLLHGYSARAGRRLSFRADRVASMIVDPPSP